MSIIITVGSLKGGVGKTTTAIGLVWAALQKGYKTLAVDFDPNNNLSDYMLMDKPQETYELVWNRNSYHFLSKAAKISECIHPSNHKGVDILPATVELHNISIKNSGNPGALLSVKPALNKLDYEIIIIDTPPSIGFEMRAGLNAADAVIVPIEPVRWTIQSLAVLSGEFDTIAEYKELPKIFGVPSKVTPTQCAQIQGFGNLPVTVTESCVLKSRRIYTAQKKGWYPDEVVIEPFVNVLEEVLR